MKSKKLLTLIIAGAVIASMLSACTNANSEEETVEPVTQVVTEAVTDEKGEDVTKDNGEVVTELVTDDKGKTVTEIVTTTKAKSTTKSKKPTTTKKVTTTQEQEVDNAIEIVLEKNMMASSKSPNVSIAQGEVVIDKPGDYVIRQKTGKKHYWHGQIIIKLKNTEKASFRFENVHIKNDSKNIIQIIDTSIKGADRTFLEAEAATDSGLDNEISKVADNDKAPNVSLSFPTGTSSSFSSEANSYTGVLYNESKLTIKGNGSAKLYSIKNPNNCICSTKSITIKNVQLTLQTVHDETSSAIAIKTGSAKGIFSFSKVILESGFLTISSNGDAIRCDRFFMEDGTANISSSACDGIDADDSITINGGNITSTALEKYSFKVRRVNNTEKYLEEGAEKKGIVRAGEEDCFRINGGKVVGESKKITSLDKKYQSDNIDSKQASVLGKIIKLNAGTDTSQDESQAPSIIKIGSWSSKNKCTKFLYSSSSVKKGTEYKAFANGNSKKVSWNGNSGVALIKNKTNT